MLLFFILKKEYNNELYYTALQEKFDILPIFTKGGVVVIVVSFMYGIIN